MKIEFKRLHEVGTADLLLLMNHELVRRQMPLFQGDFTEEDLEKFVTEKEQMWIEFGYGPWVFYVDDAFVGWGGLQPENGEADLAMVLHPDYWGLGKSIYTKIIKKAFNEMGLDSITILLPQTRTKVKGLFRLGFQEEGEVQIQSVPFVKYRLLKKSC